MTTYTGHATRNPDYKHAPQLSAQVIQTRRRIAALEFQKQRREHAFDAARSPGNNLGLGDMNLMSDSEESEIDESANNETPSTSITSSSVASDGTVEPIISKAKRQGHKKKRTAYYPWAKGLLQHAETLHLEEGLPEGLESEWSAVVAPRGKRILSLTGFANGANTVLIARASGRTLERRGTVLPPDTILDCLYDQSLSTLWVLDIIKWRGVYQVDHDFTFRSFFLSSKLSELPLQAYISPQPFPAKNQKLPLIVLPVPRYPSPLTPNTLLGIMDTLYSKKTETYATVTVLQPTAYDASIALPLPIPTQVKIPLFTTGFLLFLDSAIYHSGPSTLSAWIPNVADRGREGKEGTGKLKELVLEWAQRGGKAREEELEVQMEDGEDSRAGEDMMQGDSP